MIPNPVVIQGSSWPPAVIRSRRTARRSTTQMGNQCHTIEHSGGIGIQTSFKPTDRSARRRNPCVPTPYTHVFAQPAKIPFRAAFATASITGPWPGLGLVDEAQVEVQNLGSAAGNRRLGSWSIFLSFLGCSSTASALPMCLQHAGAKMQTLTSHVTSCFLVVQTCIVVDPTVWNPCICCRAAIRFAA